MSARKSFDFILCIGGCHCEIILRCLSSATGNIGSKLGQDRNIRVGNPSIATLVTRVVFFSYLYSSRYTLRIASILAYIFFQNHNPKDHPWFCVARLHGWRHFSDIRSLHSLTHLLTNPESKYGYTSHRRQRPQKKESSFLVFSCLHH